MTTQSLRNDHDLIQKVVTAMETTIQLLESGKSIPETILLPTIEFTKIFTDVCHHSKEENSLFPALEKSGMPRQMGPIALMLREHEISREIATRMEKSTATYLKQGDASKLISDMKEYVQHINEHLCKENNRLFMMAEARLQNVSDKVDKELLEIEDSQLKEIGKTRDYYEKIVSELASKVSKKN